MGYTLIFIIGLLIVPYEFGIIPTLETQVYDEFVLRGNIAIFRCQIPEHLKEFVRVKAWYLSNGVILKPSENIGKYTAFPTGELGIRSVSSDDSFLKVRCEVKNEKTGRTSITSTPGKLTVTEAKTPTSPEIFFQIPQITARESDPSVYLPCVAHGFPSPKYEWYIRLSERSNEYVPILSRLSASRLTLFEGLLILSDPRSSDSNYYRCIISNNLGRTRCDIKLTVYSPLKISITPIGSGSSGQSITASSSYLSSSSLSSSTSSLVTRIPINIGSNLSLNCSVKGFPVKDIKWTKDSKTLLGTNSVEGGGGGVNIDSSGGLRDSDYHAISGRSLTLDLVSLERRFEGFYVCSSANDLESAQQTVQLIFNDELPVFEETFTEQLLNSGSSVSLICSARGNPLPQVTWTLDLEPFKSSHRVRYADYVSKRDKVISFVNISSIRPEDAGLYRCSARNSVGEIVHQARVNVYGQISIKPMANRTALEGDNVWLYCPVYGYPFDEVTWSKDDEMVPSNGRQEVFVNGSLLIKNVNRKVDEGFYTCQLKDSKGSQETKYGNHLHQSSSFLKIIVGPRIDPFSFPKDMEEGMRNVAFCTVSSGDPPIYIDWYKDGIKLDANGFGVRIEMLNSFTSTITFTSLETRHTGNYTCVASNPASSANYTAEMIVKVPPSWIKEPTDFEAVTGSRVVLDCQASGFPEPQIRWKKEDIDPSESKATFKTIISNPHMHILENGSLFINLIESSDAGKYMCQAANGVNPALSKVIMVKAHSPPRFDGNFISKAVRKGDQISLTCNASGDEPITYQWKKDELDLEQLMISGRYKLESRQNKNLKVSPGSHLIIGPVERIDSALFTCSAMNRFGLAEKTFRLLVQETPESPLNLNVNDIKSDSLTLTWSEPYNGNSQIMEYVVQFRATGSPSWASKVQETHGDSGPLPSMLLNHLKPSTSYDFRVIAKNALGSSEPSAPISIVTLEKEPVSPPQDVRIAPKGSSALKVSWSSPKPMDGDKEARITGYHLAYRKAGSDSSFYIKTIESLHSFNGREEYLIGGLDRLTRYEIKIQAFNSAGDGPFSDISVVETLEYDAPKAPTLNIIRTTPASIDLTWEPSGDEPVTGYLVYYRAEGKEWISQQVNSITSYTIYGAQCGTRYQIYVLGINDAGQGDHSDTIIARTEGTAPIAPDKSSFLQPNSTYVLLNLHAWQSNGCPILYFDIQYKRHGDREWLLGSSSVPPNTGTLIISDINPATWYNLLMRAVNEAGTTDAEYVFATLTLDGSTIPPLAVESEGNGIGESSLKFAFTSKWVVQQLNLILPILCGLGILTLGLIVICSFQMRKAYGGSNRGETGMLSPSNTLSESVYKIENNGDLSSPVTSGSMNPYKTETSSTEVRSSSGIGCESVSNGPCRQAASIYYPSPYALSRIEEYRGQTQDYGKCDETYKLRPLNRIPGQNITTYHHDYDTPIFLKRVNLNAVSPSLE